ncbi:MAG: DUF559 domain-containing protein [Spirochaetes bacterium]|nr:DUF559 domain-containing protein [Spirochaetota bacterium]
MTELSRALRRKATDAEKVFWSQVRGRKTGFKFRRQQPLRFLFNQQRRFYIADFYCSKLKLVMEIDGSYHQGRERYDHERTEVILRMGLRVVRFTNEEVIRDRDLAKKLISDHSLHDELLIMSTLPLALPPSPSPALERGGRQRRPG